MQNGYVKSDGTNLVFCSLNTLGQVPYIEHPGLLVYAIGTQLCDIPMVNEAVLMDSAGESGRER